MAIENLLNMIDSNGKVSYQNWTMLIRPYYTPFVNQVYTDLEDQEILGKSRRLIVLFKYWGMKRVTTLDEAKASIPICRICNMRLALPRSTEPKNEGDEWIGVCRCEYCNKRYGVIKTAEGTRRKLGVDNYSSLDYAKRLKSELLKKHYQTEAGQVSNQKRANTCQKLYGVPNVSQAMGINQQRVSASVSSPKRTKTVLIKGKEFYIIHPSEREVLSVFSNYIDINLFNVNQYTFETLIDGKSRCHTVDYNIDDTVFLELKSCDTFRPDCTNEEYLDLKFAIVRPHLNAFQRYIIYMRDIYKGFYVMILSKDGSLKLFTDRPNLDEARKYFGKYADMATVRKRGILDMDSQLAIAIGKLIDQKNRYFDVETYGI